MKSLDGSLQRLRTDRIDVYFNHAVNDVARLKNPEWYEFVSRAKAAGKIRFTGMSGHGGRLVECLDHALDHSLVDVILVGFNFGQDPAFHPALHQERSISSPCSRISRAFSRRRARMESASSP